MRLTLRTLLSYLDNVLDEAAHAELDQQIKNSEHAGEWVHRTRDVMRRLKLSAPPIDGDGLADDPNTVAEYLDRTLPEDGVAEFERVCLESDAMLAEVASCHHALAMFLNEAPQIDPDTRQRLHHLQRDLAQTLGDQPPAPPVSSRLQDTVPADAPVGQTATPTPRVPEYLRSSERSELVRWAPAIAASLLLAVTCFIAFAPGGPLAGEADPVASNNDPANDPAEATNQPGAEPEAAEEAPASDPTEAVEPAEVGAAEEPPESDATPEEEATQPDEAPPLPEVVDPTAEPAAADDTGDAPAPRPEEEEPEPVQPAEVVPGEDGTPSFAPRFVGAESGLAVIGEEADGWRRLMPGDEFSQGSRVVVLPTSWVTLALGESFRAMVAGPAELVIDRNATGTPRIDLRYGRLLLANDAVGDNPASAVVTIDRVPHDTTISSGGALALEADRFFLPGWPVAETPAPISAVANSLSGVVEWSTRGEEIRISKPKRWTVVESPESAPPARFGSTAWVNRPTPSEVIRRAAAEIASTLKPDQPIWPQLREIAGADPFRENRALAAACNTVLGRPNTLVESFQDKAAKDDWAVNLARLRAAASRSPEAALAVGRAFEEQHGPQKAEELLELLVGFTPEEVGKTPELVGKGVAVEILLPALASDDLATRVLGSLVLGELVEPYEPAFRPLVSSRRRISSIRRLEAMIEDAKLIPRTR